MGKLKKTGLLLGGIIIALAGFIIKADKLKGDSGKDYGLRIVIEDDVPEEASGTR